MANSKCVLVFDIGGTKTASALVRLDKSSYEITQYQKCETPARRSELLALLQKRVDETRVSCRAIGISLAGQIDAGGQTVMCSPNIPELDGYRLGQSLTKKTGLQVRIQNDVRAFARGEDRFGKYRDTEDAVFLAVGTGIGGAIKAGGKFQWGYNNIAGEFGHMAVRMDGELCGCGRRGCWERYVAGRAVEKMYAEKFGQEKLARDIFLAAARGQAKELEVVEIAARYFAQGLITIINTLNPQVIVVGGSMMKDGLLLRSALPLVRAQSLPAGRKTRIIRSSLGGEAFLLGAALT
jgi:glucokinase